MNKVMTFRKHKLGVEIDVTEEKQHYLTWTCPCGHTGKRYVLPNEDADTIKRLECWACRRILLKTEPDGEVIWRELLEVPNA